MLRQLAEKLLGGLAIGVFGAVALFARVGDQPRLWDVLMDQLAPRAAGPAGPNVIWADGERPTNRMMVTADSSFAPVAAGAPAARVVSSGGSRAATVASAATPAPASSWQRHLSGVLQMFDITGPATEHSSASVAASPSAAAASPAAAGSSYASGVSAAVASAGRPGVAEPTASAYVSYGSASRSDIMSSASGPVYNFSGKRR